MRPAAKHAPGVTIAQTTGDFFARPLSYLPPPLNLLGDFNLKADGAAYGLPPLGQQSIVSRLRVYAQYNYCFGYGPTKICIPLFDANFINETAPSPLNTLPYETLPGGSTNPADNAACQPPIDNQVIFLYRVFLRTSLYNGDLCFVPTYSALDMPVASPNEAYGKYINNPTDNPNPSNVLLRYIAQEDVNGAGTQFNLPHLRFTARNSEWIFNEMQRPAAGGANDAGCTTECIQAVIAGASIAGNPPLVCYGESFTLSAGGVGGALFTWSGPSGVTFSPAQTGPGQPVTVQMPNGPVGPGDIEVRAKGGPNCPAGPPTRFQFVLQRAFLNYATNPVLLQVGTDPGYNSDPAPPQYPNSSPGPVYRAVPCGSRTWLSLYGNPHDFYGNPLTTFRWNVDGVEPASSANQPRVLATLTRGQGPSQVCLVVTNRCGQDEYYCWQIPLTTPCGGPIDPEPCVECRHAGAYPNPADTDLTVPLVAVATGQVRLRNAQGRTVRHAPAAGPQVVFDVRVLPNGL